MAEILMLKIDNSTTNAYAVLKHKKYFSAGFIDTQKHADIQWAFLVGMADAMGSAPLLGIVKGDIFIYDLYSNPLPSGFQNPGTWNYEWDFETIIIPDKRAYLEDYFTSKPEWSGFQTFKYEDERSLNFSELETYLGLKRNDIHQNATVKIVDNLNRTSKNQGGLKSGTSKGAQTQNAGITAAAGSGQTATGHGVQVPVKTTGLIPSYKVHQVIAIKSSYGFNSRTDQGTITDVEDIINSDGDLTDQRLTVKMNRTGEIKKIRAAEYNKANKK